MNFIVVAILSIEKWELIAPINTPDFFNNLQNQIQKKISARMSNVLGTELAPKTLRAEPSRAGRPPAQAKSELSWAELNSVATLQNSLNNLKLSNDCSISFVFYFKFTQCDAWVRRPDELSDARTGGEDTVNTRVVLFAAQRYITAVHSTV